MILEHVTLIIFEGGNVESEVEEMITKTRKAIVLDVIDRAKEVAEIEQIILSTNYKDLGQQALELGVIVEWDDADTPFHFGERLKEIINKYDLQNVFYMGGAGCPLINEEELRKIAIGLKEQKNVLFTNTISSADFVAFTPATVINDIELPEMDNTLANILHIQGGLRVGHFENTLLTRFDVDVLMDVMILGMQPRAGKRTIRQIKSFQFDFAQLKQAKEILMNDKAEILLCGRVGQEIISYLDHNTRCRVRVFSEERGMRALGRIKRGEVVSLLGYFMEEVGFEKFFSYLSKICDAAFIDTRVLFAHLKRDFSKADRFYSDIGMFEKITDPFLKDFTRHAVKADIPIIMAGNTLVSGGIWALVDAAKLEQINAYDEKEIHKVVIQLGSPLDGVSVDTVINYLGVDVQLVAIADAHRYMIDPSLNEILQVGQVLYFIGKKKQRDKLYKLATVLL